MPGCMTATIVCDIAVRSIVRPAILLLDRSRLAVIGSGELGVDD